MTFVVIDKCIRCKYTDCVEVCPVDCFYEGPNMLAINPDECIDCGVCVPECPIDAILDESELTEEQKPMLEVNEKYSQIWPQITEQKAPPEDAEEWAGVDNKLQYLET